jgi:tripartite-type tricarboxylate transporter receptor subunit TctC
VFLVSPHVTTGKLRAIAVTSLKPDPSLPGVEPIAAQGLPGFEAYTWWGVYAPGKMPAALAERIYGELAKAINTPAVREKLVAQGIEVSGAPGAKLDDFVRREMARWAKVIKDNNIKSGD